MSNNHNESEIQEKSLYNDLIQESKQILTDLKILQQDPILQNTQGINQIRQIKSSFNNLLKNWKSLRSSIFHHMSSNASHLTVLRKKNQQFRISSEKKLIKNRRSIEVAEKKIKHKQRLAGKSLTKISKAWKSDLNNMEKMISTQIYRKYKIEESIEDYDSRLSCESLLESGNFMKWIEEDEEVGPSLDKIVINDVSEILNYSAEFSKEMKIIDKKRKENLLFENSDVSKSGWKSEFDSENESFASVSPGDIRSAIQVLKKANLLAPGNQDVLNQITSMFKGPENTNNVELFLQLLRLRKDSKEKLIESQEMSKDFEVGKTENSKIFPGFVQNESIISEEHRNFELNSINEEKMNFPESIGLSFYEHDMKFASGMVEEKPTQENLPLKQATLIDELYQNRHKAQVKKNTLDYQSTGISSQTGLRSRVTLKTVGSENSQRVLTHGDKTIEEHFGEI